MKKAGMLAILLALALLLTGCAQDETEKLQRGVIRVGNVVYTYGDLLEMETTIRGEYEQMTQWYVMNGMQPPAYSDADIRNEAINTLALQAVVLNKADQMRLDELSESELAEVNARTDAAMTDYRAQVGAMLTFPEDATEAEKAAEIDAALLEMGITREKAYRVEREGFIIEKTRAWAVSGVTVSEEEFSAAYEAQLSSDRASAEEDPFHYGMSILVGSSPLYASAGYREVEWLMISWSGDTMEAVNRIDEALYEAQSEVEACETRVRELLGEDADVDALVAQVSVTLNEVTDPANITVKETIASFTPELSTEATAAVMALADARALEAAYTEQLALAADAAHAAITPEVEDALRRLNNGEDWGRVQAHFNDDVDMLYGSPVVCADFPYAQEAFVSAAMALETPGAWSQGVYVDGYGCFIIRYAADVQEGPVDREVVRGEITAQLLAEKQEESFSSTLDIWVEAASRQMLINYDLLGQ